MRLLTLTTLLLLAGCADKPGEKTKADTNNATVVGTHHEQVYVTPRKGDRYDVKIFIHEADGSVRIYWDEIGRNNP